MFKVILYWICIQKFDQFSLSCVLTSVLLKMSKKEESHSGCLYLMAFCWWDTYASHCATHMLWSRCRSWPAWSLVALRSPSHLSLNVIKLWAFALLPHSQTSLRENMQWGPHPVVRPPAILHCVSYMCLKVSETF